VRTRLFLLAIALTGTIAVPSAQRPAPPSDLDELMSRVLTNRDENWKKLQQYILDETQTFLVTGPNAMRLFGGERESLWFPRDGFFIRSPTRVDGVQIGEAEREREEQRFLRREQAREKRRAERRKENPDAEPAGQADPVAAEGVGDILRQTVEPEFVSSAYFLRFKFDEGRYALVGREQYLNRDVLRIEYYPTRLFNDDGDRGRGDRGQGDRGRVERDPKRQEKSDQIERQMNKVAKATLWVEPAARQIVRYQLHNIDMDFLPGRSMVRADELNASMRMNQPFPDIWLPESLEIRAGFTTAAGRLAARYDVKYSDYRLASTAVRVR
jgi:hypothetical protein